MASIESITAGKLLQEFIKDYDDEPFGKQALVITKQLLDLAFPDGSYKEILKSSELEELLEDSLTEYNFRKHPFFEAIMQYLHRNPPEKIKKMKASELKAQLTKLLDVDRPFPSFGLSSTKYELSGNPESASLASKMLEGALISTTSSLFCYLLIRDEKRGGKFFNDLDRNIRLVAERILKVNNLITFLSELQSFNWNFADINGCIPSIEELGTKDVCRFLDENSNDYLENVYQNILSNFEKKFKEKITSLINTCCHALETNQSRFELDDWTDISSKYDKIKDKVIKDLKKIENKLKNGKNVNLRDIEGIKSNFNKECMKIEKNIEKEFQEFKKRIELKFNKEPKWLKFKKKNNEWQLESVALVQKSLNEVLTLDMAFGKKKKSKKDKQVINIFRKLGGIHFAMEIIIADYFYERLPSRLLATIETPAKMENRKEIKFLQELKFNEGLKGLSDYLVPFSNTMLHSLLEKGIQTLYDFYFKESPMISIDEENSRHPKYIDLLDINPDFMEGKNPKDLFGEEYFTFRTNEVSTNIGLNLSMFEGKGNDLFTLLVSTSSLENAAIYKKALKTLGSFAGYVYSTAIGNMRVCPPALKAVEDLFL
ncbi:MAG: hypothetical protein ACTSPG_07135 [Candidatus Hodarchaeales archaeon]